MAAFKTAAVFVKRTEPMADALLALLDILEKAGVQARLEETTAQHLPGYRGYSLSELGQECDVIIIIGGDGTTLGIARRMRDYHLPIIAINGGRLGFITDFSSADMQEHLPAMLQGCFDPDVRAMLWGQLIRDNTVIFEGPAVNEVGITHGRAGSMVEFAVSVSGSSMARQRADGVIVATATGSTAYAMAAGGPILHPALQAMVLVPVAPHTLSNRPIVLPSTSNVEIRLIDANEASMYCDMQDFVPMQKGDRLLITSLPRAFTLLHPFGHNHYETLRQKLHWNRMPTDSDN